MVRILEVEAQGRAPWFHLHLLDSTSPRRNGFSRVSVSAFAPHLGSFWGEEPGLSTAGLCYWGVVAHVCGSLGPGRRPSTSPSGVCPLAFPAAGAGASLQSPLRNLSDRRRFAERMLRGVILKPDSSGGVEFCYINAVDSVDPETPRQLEVLREHCADAHLELQVLPKR